MLRSWNLCLSHQWVLAREAENLLGPREELVSIHLPLDQCTWISRRVVSACCCQWQESCSTLIDYKTQKKRTHIRLPMVITSLSITITLIPTHKHVAPFTQPMFIIIVSPATHPACLLVLRSPLAHVSAQLSVFLLLHGISSNNISCLFHGLVFFLPYENSLTHPYIAPAKNWGLYQPSLASLWLLP